MSPQEVLEQLEEGNLRFVEGRKREQDVSEARREELATYGQNPMAVIIGCSDSRVPPELIFDQGLGDLFVIRTAGHVLDMIGIGSVEYAVASLSTPLVVVLGHEDCGAVKATVDSVINEEEIEGAISSVVEKIKPLVEETLEVAGGPMHAVYDTIIDSNVSSVMEDLLNKSAAIREAVDSGQTMIIGAKYLSCGQVIFLP